MTIPPQIPIKILGFAFPGAIVTVSPDSNIGPDAMWFARRGNTVYVVACHKRMELVPLDVSEIGSLLLDSPQSMWYAARWSATQLGAVNPSDVSLWRTRDPYGRWSDRMRPYDLVADGQHIAMFVDGNVNIAGFKRAFSIPGLTDMTYPEVVAAVCMAVGGAS